MKESAQAAAQAVITGASGLVGGNLAALLLDAGHRVRCTRRKSTQVGHLAHLAIEWVEADLNDTDSLIRAFSGADVVFHCAADTRIMEKVDDGLRRNNVEGTRNVLTAIERVGSGRSDGGPRLVHCSSVVTVAIAEGAEPAHEDLPWNFAAHGLTDGYAITKRESEELALAAAAKLDVVVVNPTYMLGPLDARPSSGQMIIGVVKGELPGFPGGGNNFVDVRDVCRGMILAWHRGRRGQRYILGGRDMQYGDAMRLFAKVAGVKPPRWNIPAPLAKGLGFVGSLKERLTGTESQLSTLKIRYAYCTGYRFRSDKAIRELGYTISPLEPAVADAIAWFRKNGML